MRSKWSLINMDHFQHIYTFQAAAYHQMIAAEDTDGNLLPALEQVVNFDGKSVLDLGTGTGRLPLLLCSKAAQIVAMDYSMPMLQEQMVQRKEVRGDWHLIHGDMRTLSFPDQSLDVAIAGWAIGHIRSWFEADWRAQINNVIEEMHRVVKTDGTLIILETLTTGSLIPAPPNPELGEYYAWLESRWGFERHEIRTDYQFSSVREAIGKTEFFFGTAPTEKINQNKWTRLPEWTGVWAKNK